MATMDATGYAAHDNSTIENEYSPCPSGYHCAYLSEFDPLFCNRAGSAVRVHFYGYRDFYKE
ncbi:hypothetical protein skT53_06470 [Effusibacillus dendaii]|uniref:Uncharacterized protein n=1 Tax=Effusibacillus dendaii TaxID=2743772 RepID=A0A7I8D8H1_9BACL|nr:hypothetical protein skT53_06470 [Effusibacillus dendaii]